MEPITTGLLKAAVAGATKEVSETAKKEAESLWKIVCGESAKAAGSIIALPLNKRLFRNVVKATVEANQLLKQAGITPKEVPLTIIHPLLQAASLEEDPDMQSKWATLLANAANPATASSMERVFVSMLSELTPRHVKFLDTLYKLVLPVISGYRVGAAARSKLTVYQLRIAYTEAGLSRYQLAELSHEDLIRSGDEIADDMAAFELLIDILEKALIVREVSEPFADSSIPRIRGSAAPLAPNGMTHEFTELGLRFVIACQPLGKPDSN